MNENVEMIIDIEEYGKSGTHIPNGKRYQIRIDKEKYVSDHSEITGKQLLELAGKAPVERYALYQKLRGGQTVKIEQTTVVDLCTPGVERFMTIPLDSTEG